MKWFGGWAAARAGLLAALIGVVASLPQPVAAAPGRLSTISLPSLALQIEASSEVSYYNQIASPSDIALVGAPNAPYLGSVSQGQGLLVYTSWAAASPAIATLSSKARLVGYDPEHWSQTPASEQANLVATVKAAAAQVHAAGRSFFLAPDDSFDLQDAAQLAPYVDDYCIQAEHQETNPATFASFVSSIAGVIRAANPHARIYVQVSTEKGSPQQILTALQSVQGQVNGTVLWSGTNQLSLVEQTVALIRGNSGSTASAAAPLTIAVAPAAAIGGAATKPATAPATSSPRCTRPPARPLTSLRNRIGLKGSRLTLTPTPVPACA